jgi:peroxiredoxin family protein
VEPERPSGKVAIFVHSGDYDRVHHALSVAAAAAAVGRRVELFLFWWALERILSGELDEPDFPAAPNGAQVASRFEERNLPTLRQLLGHLRELGGCRIYACSGSLAAVRDDLQGMDHHVDEVVGWGSILKLTQGVTDRFYL